MPKISSAKNSVIFILLLLILFLAGCCSLEKSCTDDISGCVDMREGLEPKRVTMAMWDYSWFYGHYEGGPYEDWSESLDDLKERGFNTVRIDCFPHLVSSIKDPNADWQVPANPNASWGYSEKDVTHKLVGEVIEFVRLCKEKDVYVILSTWGAGKDKIKTKEDLWQSWDFTLNLLKERDLTDHVLYVDFDQEFPYFSPFQKKLNELGKVKKDTSGDLSSAMEAAGKTPSGGNKYRWNQAQMHFVKDLFESTFRYFHEKYPELRFTFSLTGFQKEVRALEIKGMDVLEVHIWSHGPKFDDRSQFGKVNKSRAEADRSFYMEGIEGAMKSVRPMILKEIENKIKFAKEWSEEIAAPLTTSEAWGPWWYGDDDELDWQWLKDLCEDSMKIAGEYEFWGVTPWNYAHPTFNNWEDVKWYRKVNNNFLKSR